VTPERLAEIRSKGFERPWPAAVDERWELLHEVERLTVVLYETKAALTRRVDLHDADGRALFREMRARGVAEAALAVLTEAVETLGVAIYDYETEPCPLTYDARTVAIRLVMEAMDVAAEAKAKR